MYGHVSKCVKMWIKPTGGIDKNGKHIIAQSRKREGCAWSDRHHGDASQVVTSKQGLMGVRCNHATTNPPRVSNIAKPKTREANTSIKHRNKQA